jgi:hypothetical protein
MFRRVSAAIVLASAASLSFAAAQAPKPKPVAPALPDQPNLITNASFEEPVFAAPRNFKEGGSPAQAGDGKTIWRQFRVRGLAKENEGVFDLGVTNQIARTGKQSVYVDLKNVTARDQRAYLMTDLMPVQAGYKYRVGIWGRIDKNRPLTLDQRRILMKAEMEFFTPATDENAGELESRNAEGPAFHLEQMGGIRHRRARPA